MSRLLCRCAQGGYMQLILLCNCCGRILWEGLDVGGVWLSFAE
jgi:hypothetical protein